MPIRERFRPVRPVDLRPSLRRAFRYPAAAWCGDTLWRATRTPHGTATTQLRVIGDEVEVTAWGDGARWAVEHTPSLVGAGDDDAGFDASLHPVVQALHAASPGMRIVRTAAVFEALVPAILEQKVQGPQARRAYRALVGRHGEAAPGPGRAMRVRVPPAPEALARLSPWDFHRFNVEARRAATIITAARHADRLEECAELPLADAYARLQTLPGIGVWTAAEVAVTALGDADAVSLGDFHLPNTVAYALAREPRADDARMLELLAPWSGHRARVVKLIEGAGLSAPRYGPRLALHDIRDL